MKLIKNLRQYENTIILNKAESNYLRLQSIFYIISYKYTLIRSHLMNFPF